MFRDICMKNLDWPEALWDAWISFEQVHGSVEELELAMDRIEFAQGQTNLRRQKVCPLHLSSEIVYLFRRKRKRRSMPRCSSSQSNRRTWR